MHVISASAAALAIALLVGMPATAAPAPASSGIEQAQTVPADSAAAPRPTDPGDIVVTARRREEAARTTPVSVSAFSQEALVEQSIRQVDDLNKAVPGFTFYEQAGKFSTDVVLRGLYRVPLGLGIPAVVSYFADVPLPSVGSNIPLFDLQSVQVLKGPQGTLFGRSTLGGAVLIVPAAPSFEFGGYADLRYGNFNRFTAEGALNIPIVEDKLAVRIGGQHRRGDGYANNLSGGPKMNNIHEDSFRVSVLFKPTDRFRNTFIYDRLVGNERSAAVRLASFTPGVLASLFAPAAGTDAAAAMGATLDAQLAEALAIQNEHPHAQFTDNVGSGLARRKLWGISNRTEFDLSEDVTIRNIFGLRQVITHQTADTVGVPTLDLFGAPFTMFHARDDVNQKYLTDELQVLGNALDGHLNWIVGGFYNHDWQGGPAGSQATVFSIGGAPGPATTVAVEDHNYALYGQVGIDLSDWVTKGLTLNLGYRQSWDRIRSCGGAAGADFVGRKECDAIAALGVPGTAGIVRAKGQAPSWTIGLDFKASDRQFFYITSRRGYRGVNVNTPLFTTVYTTGGASPLCAGGTCPDLRPFQTTKPEKLTDVEIGSKTTFFVGDVRANLDVAAYVSKYQGALQFLNTQTIVPGVAPDSPYNGAVGVNAADETIKGIEAALNLRVTPHLSFSFNGAYIDADIDKAESPSPILTISKASITLPSPRFSGTAAVRWVAPQKIAGADLIFNADYFGTEKYGGQNGIKLRGYSIGNARIDLQHIRGTGLDIGVYVKNITDKVYQAAPSVLIPGFPISAVILGEPRTFGAELRYSF